MPVMELELAKVEQRRMFLDYDKAVRDKLSDEEIQVKAEAMREASRKVRLARTAERSAIRSLVLLILTLGPDIKGKSDA